MTQRKTDPNRAYLFTFEQQINKILESLIIYIFTNKNTVYLFYNKKVPSK